MKASPSTKASSAKATRGHSSFRGFSPQTPPPTASPPTAVLPEAADSATSPRFFGARGRALLEQLFALDGRSLAVFRIGLGLLLLSDVWYRLIDFTAFHTANGVLPLAVLKARFLETPYYLSPQMLSDSPVWQGVLLTLAALSALALALGWKTRAATFLSYLLIIGVQTRNPMVLQGGDILLRVLTFWALFLPLGGIWSLDARSNAVARGIPDGEPPPRAFSFATAALLLQVCLVYWFTAILKNGPEWHGAGTAVYYALSIDHFARPPARWLLGQPDLMRWLTHATLIFEAAGPVIAVLSGLLPPLRILVVLVFWGFHLLGLNLFMDVGPFSYICAVAWLPFLPAVFWNRIHRLRPITSATPIPPAPPVGLPGWANGIAAFFGIYILLWNIRTTDFARWEPYFPVEMNLLGTLTHTDQMWDMFSPRPMTDDGWFVMVATLADGTQVDVFRDGAPVSWEKPTSVREMYRDERWRKYLMNLWLARNGAYRPYYGQYLRRQWDAAHPAPKHIGHLEIYYVREDTPPLGSPAPPVQRVLLWNG